MLISEQQASLTTSLPAGSPNHSASSRESICRLLVHRDDHMGSCRGIARPARAAAAYGVALSMLALLLHAHFMPAGADVAKGPKPGAAAFAEADDDDEDVAHTTTPPLPPPSPPGGVEGVLKSVFGGKGAEGTPPAGAKRSFRAQVASTLQDQDLENLDKYDEDEFEGLETLKEKRGDERRKVENQQQEQRKQQVCLCFYQKYIASSSSVQGLASEGCLERV